MPEKPGNGGHGLETYDPNTGKYIESEKAEGLLGVKFNNKTFQMPKHQQDYIKQHPYFKDAKTETISLEQLVKDNDLSNPDTLSNRIRPNKYDSVIDSSPEDVIYGKRGENGKVRLADGRHRVWALYNSGYDSIEMPIVSEAKQEPLAIDTSTTGMSYYDNFLNEEDANYMRRAKNLQGDIKEMSPREYFEYVATKIFNTTPEELLEQRRSDQDSSRLMDVLNRGEKLRMPMIDNADKGQEGLHRMMVIGDKYGWDTKHPVLVVDWADKDYEIDWRKKRMISTAKEVLNDSFFDKQELFSALERKLPSNVSILEKSDGFILMDGLASQEFPYPEFEENDLDELLTAEDLMNF